MPFVFLIVGLLLLIVAVRGTQHDLYNLLQSEFTGQGNFVVWVAALLVLGALGYIPIIQRPARAMSLLVILVLVLKDQGGFFSKFNDALRAPVAPSGSTTSSSANPFSSAISGVTNWFNTPSNGTQNPSLPQSPGVPINATPSYDSGAAG